MKIQRDLIYVGGGSNRVKRPSKYHFNLKEKGTDDLIERLHSTTGQVFLSRLYLTKRQFQKYGLKLSPEIIVVTLESRVIKADNRQKFLDKVTVEDFGISVSSPTLKTWWDYEREGLLPQKEEGFSGEPYEGFLGFFQSIKKIYPRQDTPSPKNQICITLTEPEYRQILELPETAVMRMSLEYKLKEVTSPPQ